jgi:hypothetical protein
MEKRVFLLCMLIILTAVFVCAQEAHRIFLGVGIEGNLNSRQDMAMGQHLTFDYGINRVLSAGLKWGFSHNFNQLYVLEPEAFVRWYFKKFSSAFLFLQADLGASIIFSESAVYPLMMGGITGGIRFPLNHWYIEPYVRGGYPFMVGAGANIGYRF